jgi:Leucine-rich repeat (LRR) protein
MATDPSETAAATLLVLLEYEAQIATKPDASWKRLDLTFHRFRTLPAAISHLADVQELDLNGCGLEGIPDELGRMERLEALHLQGNRLASIPLPRSLGRLVRTFPYELDWRPSVQSG